jgi:hypothetical protein
MWNAQDFFKWPVGEHTSPTSEMSNTVCISDPDGNWPAVQVKAVKELSEYGEIARLDTSLVVVARCVLVTYFDVRSAQRVLLSSAGRVEPFPAAAHDCRIVRVNMAAFAEKVDHAGGGFSQFGEVANISTSRGDAIVEFFDIRAAQLMLAASHGTATPWVQDTSSQASAALLGSVGLGTNWLSGASTMAPTAAAIAANRQLLEMVDAMTRLPNGLGYLAGLSGLANLTPLAKAAMAAEDANNSEDSSSPQAAGDKKTAQSSPTERSGNRPVRTKVTTKEFQKYDIDTDRIQSGEDRRTTCMIRNLSGSRARKDFLTFLEKCDLGDRYTFFYMPCKEHRNVPAGFAFVNFVSANDVHKLFVMVKSGFWREFISDPQSKAPALSYARFQGHDELVKHFSSSAVLHEQDAEKRPIFKPEAAAKARQERERLASESKTFETEGGPSIKKISQANRMPSYLAGSTLMPPGLGGDQRTLTALISKGLAEAASEKGNPVYVKSANTPYPANGMTMAEEHGYLEPQMGA